MKSNIYTGEISLTGINTIAIQLYDDVIELA